MKITILLTVCLCLIAMTSSQSADNPEKPAESKQTPAEIDWDRAKALNRKARAGEKLSAEDQAFLDRALKARAEQRTGTAGDGSNEKRTVPPAAIPEKLCPVRKLKVTASGDGQTIGQ